LYPTFSATTRSPRRPPPESTARAARASDLLLLFLLGFNLSSAIKSWEYKVIQRLRLNSGRKRFNKWIRIYIKTYKNIADHFIIKLFTGSRPFIWA
jgi:uncharacterized protein Veg